VDDKEALRERGANWNATAKVTVQATPVGERVLTGIVPVVPRGKEGEPQPSATVSPLKATETPSPVAIGVAQIEFEKAK